MYNASVFQSWHSNLSLFQKLPHEEMAGIYFVILPLWKKNSDIRSLTLWWGKQRITDYQFSSSIGTVNHNDPLEKPEAETHGLENHVLVPSGKLSDEWLSFLMVRQLNVSQILPSHCSEAGGIPPSLVELLWSSSTATAATAALTEATAKLWAWYWLLLVYPHGSLHWSNYSLPFITHSGCTG